MKNHRAQNWGKLSGFQGLKAIILLQVPSQFHYFQPAFVTEQLSRSSGAVRSYTGLCGRKVQWVLLQLVYSTKLRRGTCPVFDLKAPKAPCFDFQTSIML